MDSLEKFLSLIAYAEGTYHIGDRGYNCIIGSTKKKPILFTDYREHPRKGVFVRRLGIYSTAAGRYQILLRYYRAYKRRLSLKDFSPASQDAIAVQMIKEQGALDDIHKGKIQEAILKCHKIWASFPGSPHKQSKITMKELLDFYERL